MAVTPRRLVLAAAVLALVAIAVAVAVTSTGGGVANCPARALAKAKAEYYAAVSWWKYQSELDGGASSPSANWQRATWANHLRDNNCSTPSPLPPLNPGA